MLPGDRLQARQSKQAGDSEDRRPVDHSSALASQLVQRGRVIMAGNEKAPAVEAGAIEDLLSGGSEISFNLVVRRQQAVVISIDVPARMAAIVLAVAFKGSAHG